MDPQVSSSGLSEADGPPSTSSRPAVAAVTTTAAATFGSLRRFAAFEAKRAHRIARPIVDTITPLGWLVIAVGFVSWLAGVVFGWRELVLASATCLMVLVIACGFVVGHASLRIEVELDPVRVVAGDPAAGRVTFANRSTRRMTPLGVELPVGQGTASFRVPMLGPGVSLEELFIIPTERRGVIPVGPPTSVRGDPVGLLMRRVAGGEPMELIVHPRTVPLPPFGTGLLRDLEGLTTREVSASDLAFHSLRDYEPGDDRRFIHWRSSAKRGVLQVRQFLDTRRSALAVVVDSRPDAYGEPDEFEIALQVAGSLAVRAARDELQALVVAGEQAALSTTPHLLLDALARAEPERAGSDIAALAGRAAARAGDTTMAVLVSGSKSAPVDFQRAASRFAPEVRIAGIRIHAASPVSIGSSGRTTIMTLGQLSDLPVVLSAGIVV